MRVNKRDALKVVGQFLATLLAYLLITLFMAEQLLYWLNTVLWVYVSLSISGTAVIERLYLLLFGIFFVLPPTILGGINFLSIGQLFPSITLEFADTIWLEVAITVFLLSFFFAVSKNIQKAHLALPKRNSHIENGKLYRILIFGSFFAILAFNVKESIEVYTQGYAALFLGELKTQKGLPVLFIELTFICLAIIGLRHRKNYTFWLFIVYSVSLMGSGQRMPGATLLLAIFVFYRPHLMQGTMFIFYILLGLMVAPPILMFVQTLRAVGIEGIADKDVAYYYTDIWAVIGHSMDTLKVAIISDRLPEIDVNPFAKIFKILNVIFARIFGVALDLNVQGYGSAFSQFLAPNLFSEKTVTFASSSIAESYYFLGLTGVAFYGFSSALICRFLTRIIFMGSLAQSAAFIVFLPRFLTSVRNELFGWIIEGTIYFVLMLFVMMIMKRIFVSSAQGEQFANTQEHPTNITIEKVNVL
jgi:hypothetical protein